MEIYDSAIFANDDDDSKNYVSSFTSLSQLDLDLQQQAQAAMQQGAWPDLDMFLPQFDYQALFYNIPATPPSAFPTPSPPQRSHEQSFPLLFNSAFFDSTVASQGLSTEQSKAAPIPVVPTMPISPPVISFETTPAVLPQALEVKTESELMPVLSILESDLLGAAFSISPEEERQITPPPETLANALWSPLEASGKVPIQRLKLPETSPVNTPNPLSTVGLPPARQQKKTAHNAIERRYRNNINDRITELKNIVPALVHAKVRDSRIGKRSHRSLEDDEDGDEDGEELADGVAVATKLNKATILRKATEYIGHLKQTGEDMQQENALLQQLLTQLPGGTEVLSRYRMSKVKREEDLQRQRMQEQQMMTKHGRKHTRKRTKTQDDYSSPSSSAPATPPPAAGNRVFMAIFAFLTFFSSSPFTTGPSSAEQFQNHQHSSRTTSADSSTVNTTSDNRNLALDSFLPFEDGWNMLRTAVFILFLAHLLLPIFRSWLSPFSFNIKRVSSSKRMAAHKRTSNLKSSNVSSTLVFTPGDRKCFRIYDILVKTLEADDDGPPRTTLSSVTQTLKEACRFISRHLLEYEIMYSGDAELIPEDEWEQACNWIKLNEIECLGGNPEATRWTMLHSCLRMINLVEVMESEDHSDLAGMRARAYTTAAMQLSSVLHGLPFSKRLVRDFLGMAICETVPDISNADGDIHMRSLTAMMFNDSTMSLRDQIDTILKSRAWGDTIEILNHQMGRAFGFLSLSLASPVLVPAALLSNLHLLDNMQKQYDYLIKNMVNNDAPATSDKYEMTDGTFFNPSPMADPDQQQLAYWLAAVGMTVGALWKNDSKETEKYLETVVKRIPRGITSGHGTQDIVAHKKQTSQIDELTKKSIVRTLVGAILIKRGDATQGIQQLDQAELIRSTMKDKGAHVPAKNNKANRTSPTLETTVLTQAEFAVGLVGLEAWITAWKLTGQFNKRVRDATVDLRRMLNGVKANHVITERLYQLTRFLGQMPDEDSDLDDDDDDNTNGRALQCDTNDEGVAKRADKALDILHGIATC